MCGIVGIYRRGSILKSDLELVRQMSDLIQHRGPDGFGFYQNQNVSLAHRRLSIIDIEGGSQPLFNENRSIATILNGEIYNYLDLRKELIECGHIFKTQSDTEVLVHGYEEWGTELFPKLNGMFAFAIYDSNQGHLWLVRDRFGVKPLYYALTKNKDFAFASEIKSLRPFLKDEWNLNRNALSFYLTLENVPTPYSIIEPVQKLESAHALLLNRDGKIYKERYWNPHFNLKHRLNETDASYQLNTLIGKSVRLQCQSDVPIGVFLSGGLDSSLIAAHIHQLKGSGIQSLQAYSIAFDDPTYDESIHATQVAKHLDITLNTYRFNESELLKSLNEILNFQDEPFADPAILPLHFLSKNAKKSITVALTGDGADEIFAGYPTYLARKFSNHFPASIINILEKCIQKIPSSTRYLSFEYKLKRWAQGFQNNNPDIRHQIWLGALAPDLKSKTLINDTTALEDLINPIMKSFDGSTEWERSLWLDFHLYLQDNMFVKSDRASMLCGLEIRVPYLDNDLVDFVFKLPSEFKLHRTQSKWILKKAAENMLSKNVIYRKKHGFGVPISRWLQSELNEWMMDLIHSKNTDNYFHKEKLVQMATDHTHGKTNYKKELWTILMFLVWERNFYQRTTY